MPNYPHLCKNCGHYCELILPIADRNDPQECPECGEIMKRQQAASNFKNAFQMGAIMNDGSFVPGHFGKEAPRDRKK